MNKNSNDVKIVIATAAMAITLALWNVFAALGAKQTMDSAPEPVFTPVQANLAASPADQTVSIPSDLKILIGGSEPQQTIVFQPGTASQPITQTRSS